MRLNFFQLADAANVTGNGKLNVLGVFNQLNPSSYPYRHPSMTAVLKFAVELGEHGQTRNIQIQLLDEDGKLLVDIPGKIQLPELDGSGRRKEVTAMVQLNNLEFPKAGTYQMVILVNKDHKGDAIIYAEKPREQKAEKS